MTGNFTFEQSSMPLQNFFQKNLVEAGCDEAGRGCLAGPVVAAAVILPAGFFHPLLNDSKQVKENDRNRLKKIIEEAAVDFAVAMVDNLEIDRLNILKASLQAMHHAIDGLKIKPGFLLIDGNRFVRYKNIPHRCIVKGDSLYASIAAASILAKTYRDEWMQQLHEEFPHYGWNRNKGYGTAAHRRAIEQYGICKYHRKSFRLQDEMKELFS